jgi:hypothetical protein
MKSAESRVVDISPPIQEPLYQVSNESQGRADPKPLCCDKYGIPWQKLGLLTQVPLLNNNLSPIIDCFDNVLITTVSKDDSEPHNEPGKVLECRVHPSGKHYLLVAWWFERSALEKACSKYEHYLNWKWPSREPFRFVLGCQFDVIDSDTVMVKLPNDGRFCNTMVYGGVHHNHEIFSQVWKRKEELVWQRNLYSMLNRRS